MSSITTPDWEIEVVSVTPAVADTYLLRNKVEGKQANRNLRPNHVAALARDMQEGRWKRSPMPIVFDRTGRLIDGQHRLHAIIRANLAQPMVVIQNVDTDVQEVIDAPAARSAADALMLSKRVSGDHPAVASVARALILHGEGHHQHFRPNVNGARKVTNSEIAEWVDQQKARPADELNVLSAIGHARTEWARLGDILPLSVQGIIYMLLADVDRNDAEAFLLSLSNQEFGDGEGDPVKQLYDRLNLARINTEGLRIGQQLYFVITAWNAYRQGQPVKFVSRPSGGGKLRALDPKPRTNRTTGVIEYPRVPVAS